MTGMKLNKVEKVFGNTRVIHGVSLEVKQGEFCVFVGPSGCGKSTLLRMIAGLEDISSGDIYIGDRKVNSIDAAERGIAMVFQTYALYPHMTVEQNMGFGLRMNKHPKADIKRRVTEAAQILQMDKFLDRKPKTLSGGQRQRVAIGRAIVRKPEVFLFDEPLSNLDAELRVAMRVELVRLHQTLRGSTMIYVTHDQVEAMTLADRIVVLRNGHLEQAGKPLELYDNPANRFVAGFIGSPQMNFFDARIKTLVDKTAHLELLGFDNMIIDLPIKNAMGQIGDIITLGIRPEHFNSSGSLALDLHVDVAEHLGGSSLIHCATGKGDTIVVESQNARHTKSGDRLTARFNPESVFMFSQSGDRLF